MPLMIQQGPTSSLLREQVPLLCAAVPMIVGTWPPISARDKIGSPELAMSGANLFADDPRRLYSWELDRSPHWHRRACMLISGQSPIDPFHRHALRTETLESTFPDVTWSPRVASHDSVVRRRHHSTSCSKPGNKLRWIVCRKTAPGSNRAHSRDSGQEGEE
jgi:hypothetical protein